MNTNTASSSAAPKSSDRYRVQLHVNKSGKVRLYSGGRLRACPRAIATASYPALDFVLVLDGELIREVLWVFDIMGEYSKYTAEVRNSVLDEMIPVIGCESIKLVRNP